MKLPARRRRARAADRTDSPSLLQATHPVSPPDPPEPIRAPASPAASGPAKTSEPEKVSDPADRRPFYPRLLRLRHVHPNAWQRAALGEGAALVGGLLALADLASAWSVLVLPVAVAVVVKGHDLLAGMLTSSGSDEPGDGVDVGSEGGYAEQLTSARAHQQPDRS